LGFGVLEPQVVRKFSIFLTVRNTKRQTPNEISMGTPTTATAGLNADYWYQQNILLVIYLLNKKAAISLQGNCSFLFITKHQHGNPRLTN
jgi:hypothetical protein